MRRIRTIASLVVLAAPALPGCAMLDVFEAPRSSLMSEEVLIRAHPWEGDGADAPAATVLGGRSGKRFAGPVGGRDAYSSGADTPEARDGASLASADALGAHMRDFRQWALDVLALDEARLTQGDERARRAVAANHEALEDALTSLDGHMEDVAQAVRRRGARLGPEPRLDAALARLGGERVALGEVVAAHRELVTP
ncbi:MAG: hypothetical protein H6923_01055 [Alphaproteobacteria bacterium]|nr:hypothetical protein [Alphaproteobacteria bacterium]